MYVVQLETRIWKMYLELQNKQSQTHADQSKNFPNSGIKL